MNAPLGKDGRRLTDERTSDALRRPLGAYFRVNHKDLVAMHAALAEVGVLYATSVVHAASSGTEAALEFQSDSERARCDRDRSHPKCLTSR